MIKVCFNEDIEKKSLTVQVKGHAGHGVIGNDIVCSAVSILTYTAAQLFTAMDRGGDFKEPALIRLDRGDAELSVLARNEDSFGEAARVMLFLMTGFRLLVASYPENIKILEADAFEITTI